MPRNKDLGQRVSDTIEARWSENARVTQLLKDKLSQSLDNVSMVGNKLKTIKITIPAKHYYYSVSHISPHKNNETDEYLLFDDKEEIMSCTDDSYVDKFSNYILSKINEELEMNSIYEQMNKIDDTESLNEKYNVRTLKDVKKLQESNENPTMDEILSLPGNNPETGELGDDYIKLAEAAKKVKCRLSLSDMEYALDQGVDDFIDSEMGYVGEILLKEFTNLEEWSYNTESDDGLCAGVFTRENGKLKFEGYFQVVRDRIYDVTDSVLGNNSYTESLIEDPTKTLMDWNNPDHVARVKRVAKDCKFNLSPLYKKESVNSYIEDIEDEIKEMKERLDQRIDSSKELKSWSFDYTCILIGWVRVTYTDGSKDKIFLW